MKVRRIIKSDALDALRAKDRDARNRLGRHFVAFVRAPKDKGLPRGWVFHATDTPLATYTHLEDSRDSDRPMFVSFIVGNPVSQVHDSRDAVQGFCDYNSELMDEADSHASVVLAEVKAYQTTLLEDEKEPRANAVEFLFLNDEGEVLWCGYDGSYGEQKLRGEGAHILIRGCYDASLQREVRTVLTRHCRTVRPTKASLDAAVRKIRRITRLKFVGYVPVP